MQSIIPENCNKSPSFNESSNVPENPRFFRGYPRGYPLPEGSKNPRNGDKSPEVATMTPTDAIAKFVKEFLREISYHIFLDFHIH